MEANRTTFAEYFDEHCHCGTCLWSRRTLFGLECVSRPEFNEWVEEGWLCGSPYQPVPSVAKVLEELAVEEYA